MRKWRLYSALERARPINVRLLNIRGRPFSDHTEPSQEGKIPKRTKPNSPTSSKKRSLRLQLNQITHPLIETGEVISQIRSKSIFSVMTLGETLDLTLLMHETWPQTLVQP